MRPWSAFRSAACAVLALPVCAQITVPTPAPAHRGGYGGASAAPAPFTAGSGPVAPAPQTPNWLVAALQELGEDADQVLKRGEAMEREWKPIESKIDARTRELLQQGGFSESDIAAFYHPPKEPVDYTILFREFYRSAQDVLSHADLRGTSNPAIYGSVADLLYPFGNEAAVKETLAALRRDMDVYHACDAIIEELMGEVVERDAGYRYLHADQERNDAEEAQVRKTGDDGPYDDSANTAERSRFRPLEYRDHMLIGRTEYRSDATLIRDFRLCGSELQMIRDLPTFGEFERLARRRTFTVAQRTDPLVPLADVVAATHAHVRSLAKRGEAIAQDPLVQKWYLYPGEFLDFYERQFSALALHLKGWYLRRGATQAELDAVDAQMKSSESVDPRFVSEMKQNAAYEQQIVPLGYRIEDLGSEIRELMSRGHKYEQAGDQASADAMQAQAKALGRQEDALGKVDGDLRAQDLALEKADDTQAKAANFIEPDTQLRVAWVEFDFMNEAEPRKDANPTYPLKGAPVHMYLARNVAEVAMGIPMVVRMYYTLEKGDAPLTQTLQMSFGGTRVPLTLYSASNGYLSANVILQPSGGTPTTMTR